MENSDINNNKKSEITLSENPKQSTKTFLILLPGILALIGSLLGSIISPLITGMENRKTIDHEKTVELSNEMSKTHTQEAYLTLKPTNTLTPKATNTPQVIMDYVVVKDDIHLIGETNWFPVNPGCENKHYWWTKNTKGPVENFALWCPNIPQDGFYQIEVFIPRKDIADDRNISNGQLSERARYQLVVVEENDDGKIDSADIVEYLETTEFNQEKNSNGNWYKLENFVHYYFKDEHSPCIKLSDKTVDGYTKYVLFDAIRWVYIDNK